ncbi:MAG: response regulator [Limisphaerales bacterium]
MSEDDIGPTVGPQQGQQHSCHHILVADDETSLRDLMSAVLLHAGYRVDTAQDGAVAWAALQAEPYQLLITDYDMPKITGIELVRNLRFAHMNMPVIMVTGTLFSRGLTQNLSLQLAATLEKPFSIADLLDTVSKVLAAAFSLHEPMRYREYRR